MLPLEAEHGALFSSSIFAWRIPRTEGPGRQQFKGLQKVENDWAHESHDHNRRGVWGPEGVNKFPQDMERVNGKVGIQI